MSRAEIFSSSKYCSSCTQSDNIKSQNKIAQSYTVGVNASSFVGSL